MIYEFHHMSSDNFEKLVVTICQQLLGMGVIGFTSGPDGGRDAYFNGRANSYPSAAAPWEGHCVIQAKHVQTLGKSFSDNDFEKVLKTEISRITNLRKNGMDYYILFSNRKLTGIQFNNIVKRISSECDMPESNIGIVAYEQLQSYCNAYCDYLKTQDFYPANNAPLIVSPDLLSKVIEAMSIALPSINEKEISSNITRLNFEDKNKLNKVSQGYEDYINRYYLSHYQSIFLFLSHPSNIEIKNKYMEAASELQSKYLVRFDEGISFSAIMDWLVTYLTRADYVLKNNSELTRALVFYMYFSCDVGIKIC